MISRFLAEHRAQLLAMATDRLRTRRAASARVEAAREKNLPVLLDSVASALRDHEAEGPDSAPRVAGGFHISGEQVRFDIDELVFQYESVCHSVNERAIQIGVMIPLQDQQCLNTALDECIARTVIEWEQEKHRSRPTKEVHRLGSLADELRGALQSAAVSFQAIRSGRTGTHGATAQVVERSLERLRTLIEKLLTEAHFDA